jgi:hypothetical protein
MNIISTITLPGSNFVNPIVLSIFGGTNFSVLSQ